MSHSHTPPMFNFTLHVCSGGFRNSERGVQSLVCKNFGFPCPLPVTLEVRTEYLETTLGLPKRLEISKELIRECVTVPGCCCCMALLYNHLMDSYGYVRKNTLLAAKGGCICTPLTPPKSATGMYKFFHMVNIDVPVGVTIVNNMGGATCNNNEQYH